ncbi:SurA N-terminal domain-containing protein [Desulfovibrio sp. 3_1_syn3]|uniref:SurA N-terminal domain-containing protein n=1 Tax=Desulfovibrio sp. 3_1_syn3 TaxID=457398 RepID=UPI00030B8653|nr:SurA N-terminal domain-containing protein [Desulfovibrio sp. 3_1_syn3]
MRFIPLLFCCLLLAACLESRLPEGVVATVNGEPVHLRSVQSLLDSRSAALGTLQSSSLENMKLRYGEALGTLIIHALVRQELEHRQIPVGDAALDLAVAQVRGDYEPGDLSRFLADESLDEADWQALMRDHLAMLTFEKRVLLSGIRVGLDEVRAYYREHQADFQLPETLDLCLISGEERAALDVFCAAFPAGRKTPRSDLLVQCLEVRGDEVPPPWNKDTSVLKPGACAPARRQNGSWQTVALVERQKAHSLDMADAYPLIEHILLEQKKNAAFEQWLEGSLSRAVIKVSPLLKEELLTPASGRQVQPNENDDEEVRTDAVDAAPGPDAASGGQAGREEKSARKSERDAARNPRQDDDATGTGRR